MPHYRWDGAGEFRDARNGRVIEPGEVIELDEHVGDPQREMTRVDDEDVVEDGAEETDVADLLEDPDVESGTLPFNPEAHTVGELEELVADVDDAAAVRALRNLEREQQNRTTAVEALDERLDELEA